MNSRIQDFGVQVGELPKGERNKISDVSGVTVGHYTIDTAEHKTGVTVVMPAQDNIFQSKMTAACFVLNGFGKTTGLMQIEELGTLETPIALTNTLNVGLVHDAMVEYMIQRCSAEHIEVRSINPIVCECNDATLNKIQDRAVKAEHVCFAIEDAKADFQEGDVGAGKGMICHSLKGGIGSASRVITLDGKAYTIGVLVLSNHGRLHDLIIDHRELGKQLEHKIHDASPDKGSIISILATDLPVNDRQLRRIIKRTSVGLARLGSFIGHGSGEVMIGFSTANRFDKDDSRAILPVLTLNEEYIDFAFRAAAEAEEEAVLNSMAAAEEVTGYSGIKKFALGDLLPDVFNAKKVEK